MHDSAFVPFHVPDAPAPIGAVALAIADRLAHAGLAVPGETGLRLAPSASLTERLEDVRESLAAAGLIGPPRDEPMPVRPGCDGPEIARIDRSALRALGLWAEKVHLNGLVPDEAGGPPRIWLSLRARTAPSNPLAWDTLVAGGRSCDSSRAETLRKEAFEEAGLDGAACARAVFVRTMSVQYVSERGFHQELIAIHDLTLDPRFAPVCHDGEIESARLFALADLRAALADGTRFKLSSRLVTRDLVGRLDAVS